VRFRRRSSRRSDGPEWSLSEGRTRSPGAGLTVCPECHGDWLQPEDRRRLEGERSSMWLRCGQCQIRIHVVLPPDLVARLDAEAAQAVSMISTTVAKLELQRMTIEADTFAIALARDLIDAGDFGAR
jgi:hypothetical protein